MFRNDTRVGNSDLYWGVWVEELLPLQVQG